MALHTSLRPIDLARSTGISVQQVRNYESWGLLPPASRSKSGYRLYTQHHLAALKAARSLIGGYGRPRTWERLPRRGGGGADAGWGPWWPPVGGAWHA